jgi:dTDP-4-dehydrorhamnose reductase
MARIRIVVTGTQGQVVRSLLETAPARDVEVVAVGRPLLDLAEPTAILPAIAETAPHVLVSAAAYTNVERAESESALALAINAEGAGALAASANTLGIPVIHLSTDYVFDGRQAVPYRETDPLNPLSAYGRSKAQGERAVAAANPQHVIVRTSWIYSPFGRNFVKTMLALAERQDEVTVVADQIGCPTAAAEIAAGILAIARQLATGAGDGRYGLFHMAAAGSASWAEFAAAVFALSAERGGPSARVIPISSADYPARAMRPANSRLDCAKVAAVYGISLPHWRVSLAACIDRILEQRA